MKPLFEVGEEVIFWGIAKKYQGLSVVVTDVVVKELWNNMENNIKLRISYSISPDPIPDGGYYPEASLRKIPKGCGKSYSELMESLKGSRVVTE